MGYLTPSQKRRDKLYIIAGILEMAKDGVLKTQIMYKANLSFVQLKDYLEFMLRVGLLSKCIQNDEEVYKATERGLSFLQRYHAMMELLEG